MIAADINQSSDGAAVNDVNTASLQRKSLIAKILDGRREVQFSVEPGLHGVLVGRNNIGKVPGLQRPQMCVNNLRGEHGVVAAVAAQGSNSPACIGNHKYRCSDREPTPNRARWNRSYGDLRIEAGKDLLAKRGRRSLIELRKAHGRVQRFQVLEGVHTVGALFQMAFEICSARCIQFVIEVAVYNYAGAVTDHG